MPGSKPGSRTGDYHMTKELTKIEPGVILVCHWGWEQTNVDFYKVLEVSGGRAKVVELEAFQGNDTLPGQPDTMTGMTKPTDKETGKPMWRKVHTPVHNGVSQEPFVKPAGYSYARVWDGTPQRYSTYG